MPPELMEICQKRIHLNEQVISQDEIEYEEITSFPVGSEIHDSVIELEEPNNVYLSPTYLTPTENLLFSPPSIGTGNSLINVDQSLSNLSDTTKIPKKKSNDDQSLEKNNDLNMTLHIHKKLINDFTPNINAHESVIFEVSPELAATSNVSEEHAEQKSVHDSFLGNDHGTSIYECIASIQDKDSAEIFVSTNETSYLAETNTESLAIENVKVENNFETDTVSHTSGVLYHLTEAPNLEMVSSEMIMEEPHTEVFEEEKSISPKGDTSENKIKLKKEKKRRTILPQKKEWENWIEPDYERPVLEPMPDKVLQESSNDKNVNYGTKKDKLPKPVALKLERDVNKPSKLLFTHSQEQPQFGTIKLRQAVTTKKQKISSLQLPKFMLRSRIKFVTDFPSEYKYSVSSTIAPNFIQKGILSRSVKEAVERSKEKIEKLKFPLSDELELKSPRMEKPDESHNEFSHNQQWNEKTCDKDLLTISLGQMSVTEMLEEPVESELQELMPDRKKDEKLVNQEPSCFENNTLKKGSNDHLLIKDNSEKSSDTVTLSELDDTPMIEQVVITGPTEHPEYRDTLLVEKHRNKKPITKKIANKHSDEIIITTMEPKPADYVTESSLQSNNEFDQKNQPNSSKLIDIDVLDQRLDCVTTDTILSKKTVRFNEPRKIIVEETTNEVKNQKSEIKVVTKETSTAEIPVERNEIEIETSIKDDITEPAIAKQKPEKHPLIDETMEQEITTERKFEEENTNLKTMTDTLALKKKLKKKVTSSGSEKKVSMPQLAITEFEGQPQCNDTILVKTKLKKKQIAKKFKPSDYQNSEQDLQLNKEFDDSNKKLPNMISNYEISTKTIERDDSKENLEFVTPSIIKTIGIFEPEKLVDTRRSDFDNDEPVCAVVTNESSNTEKPSEKDETQVYSLQAGKKTKKAIRKLKPEKQLPTDETKDQMRIEEHSPRSSNNNLDTEVDIETSEKNVKLLDSDHTLTMKQLAIAQPEEQPQYQNEILTTTKRKKKPIVKKDVNILSENTPLSTTASEQNDHKVSEDTQQLNNKIDHTDDKTFKINICNQQLEYITLDTVTESKMGEAVEAQIVIETERNKNILSPEKKIVTTEISSPENLIADDKKHIGTVKHNVTIEAIADWNIEEQPIIDNTIAKTIDENKSPEASNDNANTMAGTITLKKKSKKTVASSKSDVIPTMTQSDIKKPVEQPQCEDNVLVATEVKEKPIAEKDVNEFPEKILFTTIKTESTDYDIANEIPQTSNKLDHTETEKTLEPQEVINTETIENRMYENEGVTKKMSSAEKPIEDRGTSVITHKEHGITVNAVVKKKPKKQATIDETVEQITIEKESFETLNNHAETIADTVILKKKSEKTVTSLEIDDTVTKEHSSNIELKEQPQYKDKILVTTKRKKKPITKKDRKILCETTDYEITDDNPKLNDKLGHEDNGKLKETINIETLEQEREYETLDIVLKTEIEQIVESQEAIEPETTRKNQEPENEVVTEKISSDKKPIKNKETDVEPLVEDDKTVEAIVERNLEKIPIIEETIEQIRNKEQSPETSNDHAETMTDTITLKKKSVKNVTSLGSDDTLSIEQLANIELREQPQYEDKILVTTKRKKKPITKKDVNLLCEELPLFSIESEKTDYEITNDILQLNDGFEHTNDEKLERTINLETPDREQVYKTLDTVLESETEEIIKSQEIIKPATARKNQEPENKVVTKKISSDEEPIKDKETDVEPLLDDDRIVEAIVELNLEKKPIIEETIEQIIKKQSPETLNDHNGAKTLKKKLKKTVTPLESDNTLTIKQLAVEEPVEKTQYKDEFSITTKRKKKIITQKNVNILTKEIIPTTIEIAPTDCKIANATLQLNNEFEHTDKKTFTPTTDSETFDQQSEPIKLDTVLKTTLKEIGEPDEVIEPQTSKESEAPKNVVVTEKISDAEKPIRDDKNNIETLVGNDETVVAVVKRKLKTPLIEETIEQIIDQKRNPETANNFNITTTLKKKSGKTVTSPRADDTLTIEQSANSELEEEPEYEDLIEKPDTKKDVLSEEIPLFSMKFETADYEIINDIPQLNDKFEHEDDGKFDKTIGIDTPNREHENGRLNTVFTLETEGIAQSQEVIAPKTTEKNQEPENKVVTKKISSNEEPIEDKKTSVEPLVEDDKTVEAIVKRNLKKKPIIEETIEQIILKEQSPETLNDHADTTAKTITLKKKSKKTLSGSDDTLLMKQLVTEKPEKEHQSKDEILVTTIPLKKPITKKNVNMPPVNISLSTTEFEPTDYETQEVIDAEISKKKRGPEDEVVTRKISNAEQPIENIKSNIETVAEGDTTVEAIIIRKLEDQPFMEDIIESIINQKQSPETSDDQANTSVETLVENDKTVEAIVKRNLKKKPIIEETIEQIILKEQSPETLNDHADTTAKTITLKKKSKKTLSGSEDTLLMKQLVTEKPEKEHQSKDEILVKTKPLKKPITKKNVNMPPVNISLSTTEFEPTDYETQEVIDAEISKKKRGPEDEVVTRKISNAEQPIENIKSNIETLGEGDTTVEAIAIRKLEDQPFMEDIIESIINQKQSPETSDDQANTNVEPLVEDDKTVEAIVKRNLKKKPIIEETIEQIILKEQSPETSDTMADTITLKKKSKKTVSSSGSDDALTIEKLAIRKPEDQPKYDDKMIVTMKRKKKPIAKKDSNILPEKVSSSFMDFELTDYETADEILPSTDHIHHTTKETFDRTIHRDTSDQQLEYITMDTVMKSETEKILKPHDVIELATTEKNRALKNKVVRKNTSSDEKLIGDKKTDVETLVGDVISVEAIVKRNLKKQPIIDETIEQTLIQKQSLENLNDHAVTTADTITLKKKSKENDTPLGSDDTLTMEQLAVEKPEKEHECEDKILVTTKRKKKPITKKDANILPEKLLLTTKEIEPTDSRISDDHQQSKEIVEPQEVSDTETTTKKNEVLENKVVTEKIGSPEKLIENNKTHIEVLAEDDITVEAIMKRNLKERPLTDETIEQIIIKKQNPEIANYDLETVRGTISLKEKLKKSPTTLDLDDTLTMQQLAIIESEDDLKSEVQDTTKMTKRQKKPVFKKTPEKISDKSLPYESPTDRLEPAEECNYVKLATQISDSSISNKNIDLDVLDNVEIITLKRKPPKIVPKVDQDIFEDIIIQNIRPQKKKQKHIDEPTQAESITYRPKSTRTKEDVDQVFQISLDTYEEENISMSGKICLKSKKRPPTFSEETDAETIEVINEFENSEGSQGSDGITDDDQSDEDLQANQFNLSLSQPKRKNKPQYSVERIEEMVQLHLKDRKYSIEELDESLQMKLKQKKHSSVLEEGEASLSISRQGDIHELNVEKDNEFENNPMFSFCPYIAETDEALNLAEGEKVKIIDRSNDDWWLIKKYISEETGWVPAQYLLNKEQYTTYLQRKIHRKIYKLPISEKANETSVAPRFLEKLRPQHILCGCNAQFETQVEGVPRPEITWFKQSVVIKPSSDFQIFYSEENLATLFIKEVQPEDTGTYTCVAKNAAGFASTTTELTVEGLRSDFPRKSQLHESLSAEILEGVPPIFCQKLKTQCVIENADVTLECELVAEPKPDITWYHNDTKIGTIGNITITTKNDMHKYCSIMTIRSVQKNQTGFYKIEAKNREGKATIDTFLKVKTCNSEAPEILEPLESSIIHEGETVVLSTHIIGTPLPNITWLKNREPLKGFSPRQTGDIYSLTIVDTKMSDVGVYSCTASNDLGTVTTEATVDVQENGSFEPPFFTQRFDELVVPENGTFTLIAKVEGNPKPEITWFKNNEIIEKSSNIENIYDGENIILTIMNADSETNSGNYECYASNSVGVASHGAKITIDVDCPVFIKNLRDQIFIKEFENLELMCETSHTVSTIWWHNGNVVSGMDYREIVQDNHQHKLIIKRTSILDEGVYKCTVKNQSTSCHVVVKPVKPEFLRVLQDFEVTEKDVAILEVEITSEVADVVWLKDSKPLDLKNEKIQYIKQGTLRKLVLSNISVHDEGEYMCKLFDQSCIAEVTVVELPPEIITKMEDVRTAIGDRAKFEIELTKGDALVHWFKDGEELQFSEHVQLSIDGKRQKLKVYNVQHDDAGLYVCQVGRQTSKANLIVERPDVEFIKRLPDITRVSLDTDALLVIEISKSDVPVQWFKNGMKVEESKKYEMVNEDHIRKLIIKKCSVDDVTEYTAVISNVKTSTQLEIEVFQSPPKISVESPKTITVDKGKKVEMAVKFSASPKPVDKWSSNGLILENSKRILTKIDDDLATLTIKNVQSEDSKNYTLKLTNPFGDASTDVYLIVRCEPEKPQGPLLIKDIANDSVTIEWKPPINGKGYPAVKYFIEMFKITGESWLKVGEVDSNCVTYRIVNLEKDSSYIFRLMAMNEIGFSEPLESSEVKIGSIFEKPGPPTGPLEILGMTKTSFTIKWNHPLVDGGSSIIDYVVDIKETGAKTWKPLGTTIYDKPYIDVTFVKMNSPYVFRISARNTVGTGVSYISEEPIVIGYQTTAPSSPVNLWVSSITSRSVTLNWSPPTSTGNSELIGYIIEKKALTDKSSKWSKVVTLDVKENQYCLENLKESEFQFRIFAENSIGLSIPSISEKITLKTHATVPSAPTAPLEIRQIAANTVIIEWGIPESNGGAAIEEYKIAIRDIKKTMWIEVGRINTDIQKLTVRELQENHEYLIRIYARNELGFSESLESDEPFRIIPASELTVIEPVTDEMGPCETASVSYSTDNTSSWLRDHNMDADISSYAQARLLRKDEYFFRIWHYAKKLFS